MKLKAEHIHYIIKDLNRRGIVAEGFQDELIDHFCSSVEKEMDSGKKFVEAYQEALMSFGYSRGLREAQKEVLKVGNQKPTLMLKNYWIIAVRNLRKHSFYSAINIGGLAVGIAACLLIVLFIKDELSYDSFNEKADRIFRVNNEIRFGGNHVFLAGSSAPTANALQQEYPEIEATVRFRSYGSYLVKTAEGEENGKEKNAIWADSTFFKVFSVPVLKGNATTALKEPGGVAISRRVAEKYFPGADPIGKSLILDNVRHAHITAVYENIPAASHFHFDILISMMGDWPVAREARSTVFLNENFNTYLLLKKDADAHLLESKLPGFLKKYVAPQIAGTLGGDFTMEKFQSDDNKYETTLMPLPDIHLYSDSIGEFEANGSIVYIHLFATIGFFILGVASINFMNLSTARSGNRAKEVGVRKIMGSLRTYLVGQFLTESILITILSFVVAVAIARVALPMFNDLAQKNLHLPLTEPLFYLILLAASILTGILTGMYPSFYLSAFKPVNVLKGHSEIGVKSSFIRSGLVIVQFVVSIFLIVGAITVNRQLNYIQSKKLGFEKEQVIIIHDSYALRPNVQSFKNEALRIPGLEIGTISSSLPVSGEGGRNMEAYWRADQKPTADNMVNIQRWGVDYDYLKTFGMTIKKGRAFSKDFSSDLTAVVVNEAAVLQLGLGENPIGQRINMFKEQRANVAPDPDHPITCTVIGVVENFHFSSFKESIKPLSLMINEDSDNAVSFRFRANQSQEAIQSLEKVWKKIAPGQPFQYSFLDEEFGKMYDHEQRLGKIFSVYALLAIVIACLGLFALTAFTAELRTKEIGIRKVLGASVSSIVLLLSKDFGKLIFIAFLLAVPLAWFGVDWWLRSYAYKAEIGAAVYLLAGAVTFFIAWLTMSYQSVKAASSDPVKSLRNE